MSKLEAALRQIETAINLYFADGDEPSIHTLAAAAYALIRDINEHRRGEPMLKDLHLLLPDEPGKEFRRYVNSPDNFLKHADKDPEGVRDIEPRWTEVLLWEASRKYCEITGEQNKLMLVFVFWFVAHHPEVKAEFEKNCASAGISEEQVKKAFGLPLGDRKRFYSLFT